MLRALERAVAGFVASIFCAVVITGCGGGGGDDDGPPSIGLAFIGGSPVVTEGTSLAVPVELELLGSVPLAVDVTVTVAVAGGTAEDGTDFDVSTADLTFPSGSLTGSQRLAVIDVPADALVEGNETISLALTAITGGAAIGSVGSRTITVADANQATLRFQAGTSATSDESTGAHAVTVQLDLDPGDTLDVTIPLVVADSFEGTAQSGVDHQAVGQQARSFAAGSPDGSTVSASVTVVDDLFAEGSETVILNLTSTHPSAMVSAPTTHTLTISDDDFAGGGLIQVSVDGSTISSGDTADLGTQLAAAGPGSITTLAIKNNGTGPLAYERPVLVTGDDYEFLVEFAGASAMPTALPASMPAGTPPASPLLDLADDAVEGVSLIVDTVALDALAPLDRFALTDIALPGGVRVDLALERVAAPWAEDALLSIDGAVAPFDPAWIAELSFWRGRVVGDPESRVFLTLSPRSSLGWIRHDALPGGIAYLLPEDIDPAQSGGVDARLVLSEQIPSTGKDLPGAYCGEALVPPSAPAGAGAGALPGAAPPSSPPPTGAFSQGAVRLAIETDHQFFLKFGNLSDANTYLTQMIAAISAVYSDQVHTPLTISYVGLHSDANDGWVTPDGPGTPSQLLTEFRGAWAPNQGGSWPASADLAHFISGANLGGGIAYIGTICSQNYAFGVSAVSGNIDWNTFTGTPNPGNWDFIVVAHELGHNFSAQHTHDYCPPVDRCQSSCSGSASCEPGTLMSYCHLCGGIANVTLEFAPKVANEMRLGVNASCVAPQILAPGETATYELRFDPEGAPGARSATLRVVHDGAGTSPFDVSLQGTGI